MGRFKLIETPELMLKYFTEYAEHCKSNPIKVHDFVGKDVIECLCSKTQGLNCCVAVVDSVSVGSIGCDIN